MLNTVKMHLRLENSSLIAVEAGIFVSCKYVKVSPHSCLLAFTHLVQARVSCRIIKFIYIFFGGMSLMEIGLMHVEGAIMSHLCFWDHKFGRNFEETLYKYSQGALHRSRDRKFIV